MNTDQIRKTLGQCLEFEQIRRSGHLARFLTFVVEHSLAGSEGEISETSIAVQALGRDDDFDPRIDPVVRVVAGRLRRALEMYALTEGVDEPVRIVLPKGSYVPRFEGAASAIGATSGVDPSRRSTLTIVLVDDHVMLRRGLRVLLDSEPDFRVVGEADDGSSSMGLVRSLKPNIVVMDISMPGMNGMEAANLLCSEHPETGFVALSVHAGRRFVANMLRAGVRGYVLKESAPEELVTAIRAVSQGQTYLSPSVAGTVVTGFVEASAKQPDRATTLTEDHRSLLALLAEGYTIPEVAARLQVTPSAVEATIRELVEQLDMACVEELMAYAESAPRPR